MAVAVNRILIGESTTTPDFEYVNDDIITLEMSTAVDIVGENFSYDTLKIVVKE